MQVFFVRNEENSETGITPDVLAHQALSLSQNSTSPAKRIALQSALLWIALQSALLWIALQSALLWIALQSAYR